MIDEFELTIKLDYLIPELLPIFGVKGRAYYHGMPKQCGLCYDLGHVKTECTNQAKTWYQYVADLEAQGIPREHLGEWVDRAPTRSRGRQIVNRGRGRGGRGGVNRNYRAANNNRGRGTSRGNRARGRGNRGRARGNC